MDIVQLVRREGAIGVHTAEAYAARQKHPADDGAMHHDPIQLEGGKKMMRATHTRTKGTKAPGSTPLS